MAPPMMRPPRVPAAPPAMPDPNKAVLAPPRIKPVSTRVYGKGSTPYSSGPDMGVRGAGIGFAGGFKPYGSP